MGHLYESLPPPIPPSGAFTFGFRTELVYNTWHNDLLSRQVPLTQPFRLEGHLASEVERAKWASEGLPSDELSIQNGILTVQANRYPLCIDP